MGSGKHPDGVATDPFTAEQQATYTRASEQLAAFHTPVLVDSSRPDERLFVAAFDGTGNSMYRDAPENHTNVAQIYRQIEDLSKKVSITSEEGMSKAPAPRAASLESVTWSPAARTRRAWKRCTSSS